jgi:nitrite reductase/ring-hydroxylating ferredoxin subunit/DMSO/TMAO reductase YedYZ heme-binding membrane subunit
VSAHPVPVGWNRSKLAYDAVLVAAVWLYVEAFTRGAAMLGPDAAPDEPTVAIRAWGTCAFLLLTGVLAIGPLARLDPRFLPLLYNRRHFGVVTCLVAVAHALAVLAWYFSFSPLDPWTAVLASDASYGQVRGFPFVPFGIAALLVLAVLAATSHDFWLAFLTPPVWKALHMSIYGAYALVVAHVAFGALQDARGPGLPLLVCGSAALLLALHLAAARKARRADAAAAPRAGDGTWVDAGRADAVPEGRAVVVRPPDAEPVAVFNDGGRLSAVSHVCAHQNGPLGEGRVIDGCVTCPWHGFQFRLEDGRAPPPFTETIATFRLALDGDRLLLDPRPTPPGTRVEPLAVPGRTAA